MRGHTASVVITLALTGALSHAADEARMEIHALPTTTLSDEQFLTGNRSGAILHPCLSAFMGSMLAERGLGCTPQAARWHKHGNNASKCGPSVGSTPNSNGLDEVCEGRGDGDPENQADRDQAPRTRSHSTNEHTVRRFLIPFQNLVLLSGHFEPKSDQLVNSSRYNGASSAVRRASIARSS
jgi:hypothetical protein